MRYIQPANRQQLVLMSTLDDLVPPQHPVRLIDTAVDRVVAENPDLFTTERHESDPGRPGFAPQTMLKLFLYGYFINCRASRKLETETTRNIELKWLLGDLSPDHWVIAAYRRDHADHIRFMTKAFAQFLHTNGYIAGVRMAVDGTKMKANARREMLTLPQIERRLECLDHYVAEYLAKLAENDASDDQTEDAEERSATETAKLQKKLATLQRQVESLTAQKAALQASTSRRVSPGDPDARLMKSRDGLVPAYNVQIAVDDAFHMIAATAVLPDPDDHHALPSVIEAVREELGIVPVNAVTDKGYDAPDTIEEVERSTGTVCHIPPRQSTASPITFRYDPANDQYICSEGKPLKLVQKNARKKNSRADMYRGTECSTCPVRSQCTSSARGRVHYRYHNQDYRDSFLRRMTEPASTELIRRRRSIVEHPIGTIKVWGGKIPLLLRSLRKVPTEIRLYAASFNLRRLVNVVSFDRILEQFTAHTWALR